jgi:hypothetical protein
MDISCVRESRGISSQSHHHRQIAKEGRATEKAKGHQGHSHRAARRRLVGHTSHQRALSSDQKVIQDLEKLNSDPTAISKLIHDIGGIENLSSWRTSDQCWSLLDLCCYGNRILPKAANALFNHGFQIQSTSSRGSEIDLPPRYQWGANGGYCGETSFVTAALNNGEYISQYDARYYATGDKTQQQNLFIGDGTDETLAKYLHLKTEEYPHEDKIDPHAFLNWVKDQVLAGNQVIMGVYMNKSVFGEGDQPDYDHIVTVVGVKTDAQGNLVSVQFSDNSLYGNGPKGSPYIFSMTVDQLLKNRQQANLPLDKGGSIYSLADATYDYGIAIHGTKGDSESAPVHIIPNVNNETPAMKDGSSQRPDPSPVTLTVCATDLKPGTYNIYVYKDMSDVPDGNFNADAKKQGLVPIQITIQPGESSYVFTQQIMSNEQFACRVVPINGP